MFNNLINIDKIDSTNEYLKTNQNEFENGTVIFTTEQTKGKGRLSRSWYGGKNRSVLCSFIIKNVKEPEDALRYSFLFSLGVHDLLQEYISTEKIVMKWPNDILIGKKKICGILSEYSRGSVIVGIGINILDFEPQGKIEYPWTVLEKETDKNIDLENIKFALVDHMNNAFIKYNADEPERIINHWAERSNILNKFVTVSHGSKKVSGTVISIDNTGILKLATGRNTITISTGDLEYNDQF